MIKFDNKLELRYYFNDKSNYMDAMIKHRSEKEVLSLVRTLADMLDIKMTVYCESFAQQEGFREIWSVAGENSRLISVLLNLFMQVWTRPSLLVGGPAKIHIRLLLDGMDASVPFGRWTTGCGPFGGRRGKDAARNCLIA